MNNQPRIQEFTEQASRLVNSFTKIDEVIVSDTADEKSISFTLKKDNHKIEYTVKKKDLILDDEQLQIAVLDIVRKTIELFADIYINAIAGNVGEYQEDEEATTEAT